jgi:serine/threonine-protein kinase HipA
MVLWEAVALNLAQRAGIPVPEARVETVLARPILLLRRFDRVGAQRIPFLSSMSMLGARDNQAHSYMEIVDALRQHGAAARADIQGLWRRIVFNVLISNTDEHLFNHGFLYAGEGGWRLSPAYDLNPVPVDIKPRILTTAINEDDGTASLDLALSVAGYFELDQAHARGIAAEVGRAVARWRQEALSLGLPEPQVARMASAFQHADLEQALSFVG